MGLFGSNWSGSDVYMQNGAVIDTLPNVTGGLTLSAQNSTTGQMESNRSYDNCAFYKAMMGAVKAEGNLDYDGEKAFEPPILRQTSRSIDSCIHLATHLI